MTEEILTAESLWNSALSIIGGQLQPQTFHTWFRPIKALGFDGETLRIEVPGHFHFEWLEGHYAEMIRTALSEARSGADVRLKYEFAQESYNETHDAERITFAPPVPRPLPNVGAYSFRTAPPPIHSTLNPRYTFESFIKGEANAFAYAAANAVADSPGAARMNPLVIYGGVGLGKTHLVQAIGNKIFQREPTTRILYTSSDIFTNDFVDSIQNKRTQDFAALFRSVDVLIIDDIQFFQDKEKTQDMFFHTFNILHQLRKQIILTSDRSPHEIPTINQRLISRMTWGLTVDIQPPDFETRLAILRSKAQEQSIDLPNDVMEYFAANVTSNIRELEGCLISLMAKVSLDNKEPNIELAKEVLKLVCARTPSALTIEDVQRIVCEYFTTDHNLLIGKTRKQEIVRARQVAMYLAKEFTNCSLKTIGLHFGGRDHSTVIHAYQTVCDAINNDSAMAVHITTLKRKIDVGSR